MHEREHPWEWACTEKESAWETNAIGINAPFSRSVYRWLYPIYRTVTGLGGSWVGQVSDMVQYVGCRSFTLVIPYAQPANSVVGHEASYQESVFDRCIKVDLYSISRNFNPQTSFHYTT